jgi:hypothetical protein
VLGDDGGVGAVPQVFDPAVEGRLAGSMDDLAVLPEMCVYEVHCRDDRRRLAGQGYEFSWNLVMVRSGGFLQRLDGQEDFYDAASAYVSRPGQERRTGHPAGPGDVCTGIWLSERLVADCFDGGALLPPVRIVTPQGLAGRTMRWWRPAVAASTASRPRSAVMTCLAGLRHRPRAAGGAGAPPRWRTVRWRPAWRRRSRKGT